MGRKPRENHPLTGVVIGEVDCSNARRACGARVPLKVAKTGTVFHSCAGELEDKACGYRGWFGVRDSQEMIAAYERSKDGGEDREEDGGTAGGGEVESVGSAERGNSDSGRKRRRILF